MVAKPAESFDNTCKYVREVEGGWEYGNYVRDNNHHLSRPHKVKKGVSKTMEEALTANGMALSGAEPLPYGGHPCSGRY